MEKKKSTFKMILASITAIGICSVLFVAANIAVLTTAFNKTEIIPTEYNTPPVSLVEISDNYAKADYKVVELENPASKASKATYVNAISRENAAEAGAQYLWELYGVDLGGKIVQMYYFVEPARLRAYWYGNVYNSDPFAETGKTFQLSLYDFVVDAVSGEVTSIGRGYDSFAGDKKTPLLTEETKELWRNNCGEYLQLAKEVGEKHLGAKIVSAEFEDVMSVISYEKAINEGTTCESNTVNSGALSESLTDEKVDSDADSTVVRVLIQAIVTDEYGRQCMVVIMTDTREIITINTIVPKDPNGIEGLG